MASLRRSALVVTLLILITGCTQQPHVRTTVTPGTDFSRYKTYAIKPGNVVYPGASPERRQEIEQRIQGAIAAEIEGRGLVPQPDNPDVIVTYTSSAQQVNGGNSGGGADTPAGAVLSDGVDVRGPSGYDEPGLVRPRENDAGVDVEARRKYREGNLVIDLLDGKSRKLVWRATASDIELASDHNSKIIDSIVQRAFAVLNLGSAPISGTARKTTTTTTMTTTQPATMP